MIFNKAGLKKYLALLLLQLPALMAGAQVNNDLLRNDLPLEADRNRSLELHMYNFSYMRNYEYFNRFADGITYFGTILQPELVFHSSENLSLSGGMFLRKDFGNAGIYDKQPVFRIDYHKHNFRLINGVINGNTAHRLPEPMYDYDQIIFRNLEYGTQFLYKDSIVDLDAWINWENMIYKVSPVQERISGGISSEISIPSNSRVKISIPLKAIAFHAGGQIDTPDRPLTTILNTAVGLNFKIGFDGFLKDIHSENYYLTYKDFSFTKQQPYVQGNGMLFNLGFNTKFFDFICTYWQGNGFQSVHGAPLYQSVSSQINNPGYTEDQRSLLFFRLISEFPISRNFSISTRLEPYIDLNNPAFEFSNSLFLVYREDFRLTKVRSRL